MTSSAPSKVLTAILLSISPVLYAQNPFLAAFHQIGDSAPLVAFQNDQRINIQGGHIQGIQWVDGCFLLSGSSSTVSYYATVADNNVIRVDTLLHRPYKHAGGFQANDGLLAIGVEDNEAKDVSQVLVYDFPDPTQLPGSPVQIVPREGEEKRATAGCVAIVQYQGQYILLVGDWDTRHLDLYQIPADSIGDTEASFALTQSITLEEHSRANWVDKNWWPYQNINLFNSEGELYLVGLGLNGQQENVADVFVITPEPELQLVKVASRTFPSRYDTSFLWGAGVDWRPKTKKMRILTTSYLINEKGTIVIYE